MPDQENPEVITEVTPIVPTNSAARAPVTVPENEAVNPPIITPTETEAENKAEVIPEAEPLTTPTQALPDQAAIPSPTTSPDQGVPSTPTIDPVTTSKNTFSDLITKAKNAIWSKRNAKLEKIMALFIAQQAMTSRQIADILHISDTSARRYLSILKKQGKIQETGRGEKATYTLLR